MQILGFALPDFYFHVAAAYGILRHNGVELGKRDYPGNRWTQSVTNPGQLAAASARQTGVEPEKGGKP
jgi:Domain of unknown function (DUF1993)